MPAPSSPPPPPVPAAPSAGTISPLADAPRPNLARTHTGWQMRVVHRHIAAYPHNTVPVRSSDPHSYIEPPCALSPAEAKPPRSAPSGTDSHHASPGTRDRSDPAPPPWQRPRSPGETARADKKSSREAAPHPPAPDSQTPAHRAVPSPGPAALCPPALSPTHRLRRPPRPSPLSVSLPALLPQSLQDKSKTLRFESRDSSSTRSTKFNSA